MGRIIVIDNASWTRATQLLLNDQQTLDHDILIGDVDPNRLQVLTVDTSMSISAEDLRAFQLEIEPLISRSYIEDIKITPWDDLPQNTTKPKFLMARDHHIRSPRGRR